MASKPVHAELRRLETLARWMTDGKAHGMSGTAEFKAFENLKQRTTNPRFPKFHLWGGRGIRCLIPDFTTFYWAVGPKPHPSFVLDRPNNEGDYTVDNIAWVTPSESRRNQRQRKKPHETDN